MIKFIEFIFCVVIPVLLMVHCNPDSPPLKQDFDRTETPIELTLIWHDTQGELDRVFRDNYGTDNPDRQGFAVWVANDPEPPYRCEIHSLKPIRVDDDIMTTMGHELTHCAIGSFH